ncbi:MAG: NapC/NirT family cytochrome c [Melioribacteraceae bacterium]|nr:NapC/NirT family cytochrome c [Melioribacteraceae bacterium]
MKEKYLNFLRGVSVNKIGKVGVILTTSSFLTFIFLELLRLSGVLTNAYIGLITYMLLPTLFVAGLILIPIAWQKYKKQTGKTTKEILNQQFTDDDLEASRVGSKLFNTIAAFTIINILFLTLASMRTLTFMDKPEFCGTACHSVMNPEWTTYQTSPHARVVCVDCHVGEGIDALVSSKLNGAWQVVSATFDLYERPIPTPVHQLRPARETCEKCHWPSKFYGSKLVTKVKYAQDSLSTPYYTTLNLKIDTRYDREKAGIHWHISSKNLVRYISSDDKREQMIFVESLQQDGTYKRYTNKYIAGIDEMALTEDDFRIMDCVDCHNRATHIYELPEDAVDERIRKGMIDRSLPFIKREALNFLSATYTTNGIAERAIRTGIERFYLNNFRNIYMSREEYIDQAINVLQETYNRNIHPGMKIVWGSYPNFIGHKRNSGCFRCHNNNMIDANGKSIDNDCTLCHSFLSYSSDEAFKYIKPAHESGQDSLIHETLIEEFIKSFN